MISSKKILEGCLLAIASDTSEKWNLYLDGVDIGEDEESVFPKSQYKDLEYYQHLLPLYKLAGYLNVNLRAGLSSVSVNTKRREISTLMDDFFGKPRNLSPISTLVTGEEDWWKSIYEQVQHTTLVIRDKKYQRVISSDLVVGDIVFLSSGDIAGADIRVIVCTAESIIDLSPLTQISHDFKKLKEKPTDLDPLKSCNVIPARCIIADGLVFGIVIKTGSSTLYATTEKKRDTTNHYQSIDQTYHIPITLKKSTSLLRNCCMIGCYPRDIDTLLSLQYIHTVVISLANDWNDYTLETLSHFKQWNMQVFLCRDINICYHKELVIPEGGFINIGNKSNDEISTFITSCKNKQTPVVGLSVYPSQYTTICKTLKGDKNNRVLFIAGNCFENSFTMSITTIAYGTAKDVCKLKADAILVKRSFSSIIDMLELFINSFSMKCTIM